MFLEEIQKSNSYNEHFVDDHNFVFQNYIEVVLDKKKQDQSHDNNHDTLNNHMDQVHAVIELKDRLWMIYKYSMMKEKMEYLLEYMMTDRLCREVSMKYLD
jgi:endonuclease III